MLPDTIYIGTTKYQRKTTPKLWRVKHDVEMGPLWREQLPQVNPMFPNQFSPLGREWQLLSRELNPSISDSRWTQCYGNATWVTNGQGFGKAGDPRNNYVTGETSSLWADPKCELLTCGGNILTGYEDGTNLVVDILDYRMSIPTKQWMLDHPWYVTYATRCGLNSGEPVYLLQSKDANGDLTEFLHPLIGNKITFPKIVFPLYKLQRWEENYLPDPMRIYL